MLTRLTVWTVISSGLIGCRADFDVSRGELGPFRIAAMGLVEGEECPTASAAIWSGEGMFHRESPRLVWSMDGVELGEGWAVSVCESGLLELEASNSAGEIRYGQLSVSVRTESVSVTRSAVDLPDLELDARRTASDEEVHSVVPLGSATRLRLGGLSDSDDVSWMSPMDQGELLELTTDKVDLLAETWTLDADGELVGRNAYSGVVSHLALIHDGAGGNRFLWIDAAFGLDESGFVRHQGRLIQSPLGVESGTLAATVFSTDDGFELREVAEASELDVMDVECAQGAASFSLDWVANGRCSLAEMNGQRVLLEVW